MTGPAPASAPRKAALAFILITVALDVLALGMIIPVLPRLVMGFMGGDTAGAARMFGVFGTVWALMQFLCSPILGMLSDRWGRRPVVLLSNFGLGFDYILMALAPTLGWLFIGRVISGITAASIPTAMAYISDVTAPEKRASAFGMIGAAFGFGFLLGPAVGGLLGDVNPRLPFWVAASLSLANAMYGIFVLPESLPAQHRTSFEWSKTNPIGSLKLLQSHPELLGLAMVNFIAGLAHEVFPSVFVLYAGHRYGWDAKSVGLTLAGAGICGAAVQVLLVPPVVRWLGERKMLLVGLLFGVAGAMIYGLAPEGWIFLCAIPVMSLWGLSGPATHGLMTRRVQASEQGQLQGANSSLRGIAGMLGPGMFTLTYAAFLDDKRGWALPGAPFLLAALLLFLSLVMAWRVTRAGRAIEAELAHNDMIKNEAGGR